MHRQLVKTVSEASPWVLAGLSRSCRLLTAPPQIIAISLWRFYYPLDSLDLKLPTESQKTPPCIRPNPLCSVCLFVCRYSAYMSYSQYLLSHPTLLYYTSSSLAPSHLACSSSISKQTHFLLTLGSVAVICCACQVEY